MRVSIYKGELLDQRNTGSYIVEGYRITYLVVEHIYYTDMILFLQKNCLENYLV